MTLIILTRGNCFTSSVQSLVHRNPPPPGLHSRSGAVWCKMSVINRVGYCYHVRQRKGHIFGHSDQIIAADVTWASETDLLGVYLDTKVCQHCQSISALKTNACDVTCQVH